MGLVDSTYVKMDCPECGAAHPPDGAEVQFKFFIGNYTPEARRIPLGSLAPGLPPAPYLKDLGVYCCDSCDFLINVVVVFERGYLVRVEDRERNEDGHLVPPLVGLPKARPKKWERRQEGEDALMIFVGDGAGESGIQLAQAIEASGINPVGFIWGAWPSSARYGGGYGTTVTMPRRPSDPVQDHELTCLPMWPEGTRGFVFEMDLLRTLNQLCQRHGYGRVPQLCEQLEELWRHPEKVEEFRQNQRDHLQMLAGARRALEDADCSVR